MTIKTANLIPPYRDAPYRIVALFFGDGYDKTATIMQVISPTIVLFAIASVIGYQYLIPTKKQKEYTYSILIGLIANFILNYILITYYASIGAAIATVISELIVVIAQIYIMRKEMSPKEILKLSYKYLFAGIIMFVVCVIVKKLIGTSFIAMISQVILGMITYLGILILMKDEQLFMIFNRIKLIIRRK